MTNLKVHICMYVVCRCLQYFHTFIFNLEHFLIHAYLYINILNTFLIQKNYHTSKHSAIPIGRRSNVQPRGSIKLMRIVHFLSCFLCANMEYLYALHSTTLTCSKLFKLRTICKTIYTNEKCAVVPLNQTIHRILLH